MLAPELVKSYTKAGMTGIVIHLMWAATIIYLAPRNKVNDLTPSHFVRLVLQLVRTIKKTRSVKTCMHWKAKTFGRCFSDIFFKKNSVRKTLECFCMNALICVVG